LERVNQAKRSKPPWGQGGATKPGGFRVFWGGAEIKKRKVFVPRLGGGKETKRKLKGEITPPVFGRRASQRGTTEGWWGEGTPQDENLDSNATTRR